MLFWAVFNMTNLWNPVWAKSLLRKKLAFYISQKLWNPDWARSLEDRLFISQKLRISTIYCTKVMETC